MARNLAAGRPMTESAGADKDAADRWVTWAEPADSCDHRDMPMPSIAIDAIGWTSSLVLMATLLSQMYAQHRQRSLKGVSAWLFTGQMITSMGFIAYSLLVGNAVFVFTNSATLLIAVAGQFLYWRQARKEAASPGGHDEHGARAK